MPLLDILVGDDRDENVETNCAPTARCIRIKLLILSLHPMRPSS